MYVVATGDPDTNNVVTSWSVLPADSFISSNDGPDSLTKWIELAPTQIPSQAASKLPNENDDVLLVSAFGNILPEILILPDNVTSPVVSLNKNKLLPETLSLSLLYCTDWIGPDGFTWLAEIAQLAVPYNEPVRLLIVVSPIIECPLPVTSNEPVIWCVSSNVSPNLDEPDS